MGEKERDPLKSSWPPAASNRSFAEIWNTDESIMMTMMILRITTH
jgi:hypothetical protein